MYVYLMSKLKWKIKYIYKSSLREIKLFLWWVFDLRYYCLI